MTSASTGAADSYVVSFNDLEWFEFVSPAISAVRHDAAAIGRLGVTDLPELIAGRPVASQRISTRFIDRLGP